MSACPTHLHISVDDSAKEDWVLQGFMAWLGGASNVQVASRNESPKVFTSDGIPLEHVKSLVESPSLLPHRPVI